MAGFSLIEVMISMMVVSVAIVGAVGSITSSASLADANREASLAYRAAQREIERIQGSTFADVWALYNADDANDPDFDLGTDRPTRVTEDYDDDTRVADAVGIDPSRGYLLLPVRVEIEWAGVSGDCSIALETIIAPH